jgi:hypothetical protein
MPNQTFRTFLISSNLFVTIIVTTSFALEMNKKEQRQQAAL